MDIEAISSDLLKETLYKTRLDCGLDVLVWPKPGFNKKFAVVATRFGSIHNRFLLPSSGREVRIPDGIAHFLEHKMFETADGDVFDQFARLGASANASTSFLNTLYLFGGTDHFSEALTILLDYVQTPQFTEKGVDKERGIITQEIRMYDDNADWQVFFRLLEALYQQHPVRIDIAGTAETIKEIDVEVLKTVYDTFYHPSNMVAFAAGDFDHREIMELVADNYGGRDYTARPEVERLLPEEPDAVCQPRVEKRMVVSRPKTLVGFKDTESNGLSDDLLRREIVTGLILDILLGKSSELYSTLYEQGVIDDSFAAGYTGELDHGYTMIGGETDQPDRLVEAVLACLATAADRGFDAADLERKKRKQVGRFLAKFNAPDTGGHVFLHHYLRGQDVFKMLDLLDSVRAEDLTERLRYHFDTSRMAVSTILPAEDVREA